MRAEKAEAHEQKERDTDEREKRKGVRFSVCLLSCSLSCMEMVELLLVTSLVRVDAARSRA